MAVLKEAGCAVNTASDFDTTDPEIKEDREILGIYNSAFSIYLSFLYNCLFQSCYLTSLPNFRYFHLVCEYSKPSL